MQVPQATSNPIGNVVKPSSKDASPKDNGVAAAVANIADKSPKVDEVKAAAVVAAVRPPDWNPEIHATGKDGGPTYNADGSYRARRGVAKSSSPNATEKVNVDSLCAAVWPIADHLGEDWKPTTPEKNSIRDSLAAWAGANDITITPTMALCIALAGYALPRVIPRVAKYLGLVGDQPGAGEQVRAATPGQAPPPASTMDRGGFTQGPPTSIPIPPRRDLPSIPPVPQD